MFALAAHAAAQAANPPPLKPRPAPVQRRNSTSGGSVQGHKGGGNRLRLWSSRNAAYTTMVAPIPGLKPILKRQPDTVCTPASSSAEGNEEEDDASRNGPKVVAFSTLDIAEHIVELGDGPYCQGPPVAIGNECVNRCQVNLDVFESTRAASRSPTRKSLAMQPWERSQLLLSAGYSVEEIANAALATHMNRVELSQSLQNRKWDKFNAVGERLRRTLLMNTSTTSRK